MFRVSLIQFSILILFAIAIGSAGLVFLLIISSPIVIIEKFKIESMAWLIILIENNSFLLYIFFFFLISCFYLKVIKHLFYENLGFFNVNSLRGFLIFINLISFIILGYILFYEIGLQFEFSNTLINKIDNDNITAKETFILMMDEINENSNVFKTLELVFITAIFPFIPIAGYYISKSINEKEFDNSELVVFYKNYKEIRKDKIQEYDDKFSGIEERIKELEKRTNSSSNKILDVIKEIIKFYKTR